MISQTGEQRDLPVLARKDSVHAQVLRPRGVHRTARANAAGSVAFRLVRRRRHPEAVISRLNGWPARTPVNASPSPSQTPAHDSGPSWIATPSMSGVLIPFLPPVYPGAPHVPRGSSRSGSRHLYAGHRLTSKRAPARIIPRSNTYPGFDAVWINFDTSAVIVFLIPTSRLLRRLFLIAHHNSLQLMQHEVV
jgi:hypothetical protein